MKLLSIKNSADFKKISKDGNKFIAKSLILLCDNSPQKYSYNCELSLNAKEFCRIGFTASKKIGNAVARNKAKRKLREAARNIMLKFGKSNKDYIIIARKEILTADFSKILSDLKFCITRIESPRKKI